MSCRHPAGFVIRTGHLLHVFCRRCSAYITTEPDEALAKPGTGPPVRMITFEGITLSLQDWARRSGVTYDALKSRLSTGWSLRGALTTPLRGAKN